MEPSLTVSVDLEQGRRMLLDLVDSYRPHKRSHPEVTLGEDDQVE